MDTTHRSLVSAPSPGEDRIAQPIIEEDQSAALIWLFLDNSLTMAWMKDEAGHFVYVSPSLEKRTGIPREQWLGKTTDQVLPAEFATPIMDNDRRVLAANQAMEFVEERSVDSDSKQSWLAVKYPMQDRRGARFVGGVAIDISARIEMEQHLRKGADRFMLPALGSKIGSHDRDLRSNTVFMSSGITQLLGIGNEPVTWTREQWLEVIHPDDVAMNLASLQTHLDGHTRTVDMKYRVRHRDGSYRWVWSLGAAQRDETGKPARIVGALIDITQEKLVEEREQRQQRLTVAMAQVQRGFLEHNDPISAFSSLLTNMLTLTDSQFGFVGELLRDRDGTPFIRSHAVHASNRDALLGAFADPAAPSLEFRDMSGVFDRVVRSNHAVLTVDPEKEFGSQNRLPGFPPINSLLVLPFSKGDEVLGIVGLANRPGDYDASLIEYVDPLLDTCGTIQVALRDQKAHRAAEVALRESEQRYRLLVEQSPVAVFVHQDGRIVFGNGPATEMLGVKHMQELSDVSPFSLFEPEYREEAKMRTRRILTEGWIPPVVEMRIRLRDGTAKDVETAGSQVTFMGRPAVQAVWRDISERKRTHERELRSRRLESLGTLAGGVAHDFNNALAAIRVNLDLAQDELPAESGARLYLDQVKLASERAATLVRQILSFSRARTERREPVSLAEVAGEVLGMMRSTIPAMIELKDNLSNDLPLVKANASQLHQVVVNLITNAIHAIGRRSGCIEVEVGIHDPHHPNSIHEQTQQVYLRVADNGCGMDEHTRERIFDPFFTTKEPGEGVGLGLAMVHEIVRTHEGHIEVSSSPGRGARFDLYFPTTDAPAATPAPVAQISLPSALRLLFLDDDPLVNFAMARMLTKEGCAVTARTDPGIALQEFCSEPEQFDVLVVDVAMPHMSGLQFARAALERRPGIPIVLASGNFEPADELAAKELGISQLVAKPYDTSALTAAIARARA